MENISQSQRWEQLNSQACELYHRGKFREAIAIAEEALELARSLWGTSHNNVATSTNNLAALYQSQGRYTEAEPLYREALALRKQLLGEQHPDVATSINNLAFLYSSQGRYTEAEPLYRDALALIKELLGDKHPNVATSMNNLAELCRFQGRYTEAEPLYREALALRKQLLGEQHPDVATSINNLAALCESQGRYTEAEPLYREALAMYKQLLGEQHPNVATSMNNLAGLYSSQGRYTEAELLYRDALALRKQLLGEQHPDIATSMNNLARLYGYQGRYTEAELLYRDALALSKQLLGEQHPDVATNMNNLAVIYRHQGRYTEAELLYRDALALRKQLLGEQHPDVAQSINNLAELCRFQGRHTEAEPLYRDALALRKQLLGEQHPDVAQSMNNLALLYSFQGRYTEAEPLYREALALRKQLLGEQHPGVATSMNNLALLYSFQGRYTEAEPLYREALAMYKQLLGEQHPDVAQSMNNLAGLYRSQGRYTEAEPLYRDALALRKQLLGEQHPDVAQSINNLAGLYRSQGRYTEAESLHRDALALRKQLLGEQHPDVAQSMNNLAELYFSQGRCTEAEPLYRDALAMYKQLLGKQHPDVATGMSNLALLFVATDHPAKALALMKEAMGVEDRLIRRTFATSPERARLSYLESIRDNFYILLSLVRNYLWDSPAAVATALDVVLKRKSLTASALAAFNHAIYSGRYPHLEEDFQRWRQLNERIVELTFSPPEPKPEMTRERFRQEQLNHQQRLTELQEESEKLERWLASQVPEIQLQEQERVREAIATELPEGSALLEFVRFRLYDFPNDKWQPARYLAFVLPGQQPEGVRAVELGDAERIDRLIDEFREATSKPTTNLGAKRKKTDKQGKSVGVELGQAIFSDELRQAVEGCQHLLFAPDGNLNLVPFQVLPTGDGGKRRLIDEYAVGYLSAGRDLLRRKLGSTRPADPPLILADPDYNWGLEEVPGAAGVGISESGKGDLPKTLAGESWFERAIGTDYLGETAGKILEVKPYLQRDASESRLTGGNCPRVLLVATHGEFAKEDDEYFELINKLLQCPPEEKRKILENNWTLLDRELVEILERSATRYANNGNETLANWLQNMAKQVEEMLAPTPTTPMLDQGRPAAKLKNPMLRSAIALAAANTWLSGRPLPEGAGKKGVVHAQDIAALDLWGCELAVLSACQTGLGDIRMGEGVFGMRRAFAIAGTQTLIMSLWSVPARATALLMERFFANLRQGVGRGDALQAAQNYLRTVTVEELEKTELGKDVLEELESDPVLKKLLAEPQPLAHPYFWGAWVCQGDTRGLQL